MFWMNNELWQEVRRGICPDVQYKRHFSSPTSITGVNGMMSSKSAGIAAKLAGIAGLIAFFAPIVDGVINQHLDLDAASVCLAGLTLISYAGLFAAAARGAARLDAARKRLTLSVYEGEVSCQRRRSEQVLDIDEEGNWLTTVVMQSLTADAKNFLRAISISGCARVHYVRRGEEAFVVAIEALPETVLKHMTG